MSILKSVKMLLSDEELIGQMVQVQGWLKSKRDSKAGISFLTIHDGSHFSGIQAVIPNTLENYSSEVLSLSTGCSVLVAGTLVSSEGKGQRVEIQGCFVEIIGGVDDPESYPIAKKRHSFEYLRTQAHLRSRTNTFSAVTRVRHVLARAIHNFFHINDFFWVNTPIITGSDCEGAGELFKISTLDFNNLPRNADNSVDRSKEFFCRETYLTVSGQLAIEAYCLSMTKVYTFGPTFRAENSHTSRHLAEFWMVEPEIAFADLMQNADWAEKLLKYVVTELLQHSQEDLSFFQKRINNEVVKRLDAIKSKPFERITYTNAIKILKDSNNKFEYPVSWGADLASEHERFLAEQYFKVPVVVTDYPSAIKAFYMRLNDDEETVAAMDVLAPGIGEIIGGSQREERLEVLDSRMNTDLSEKLWWYRDLRRYGSVPHAGFGLGFERLLAYVTGMDNVRDVVPFPRTPGHAEF